MAAGDDDGAGQLRAGATIGGNLRHLRVLLSVHAEGSATRAAQACRLSQPAVTQAIARLETAAGQPLFRRMPTGLAPMPAGESLALRAGRALARLDAALADIAPRLVLTATRAQLWAFVAVAETGNFTLAAQRLGVAQPTVHRAVTQLERETGRPLFRRAPTGLAPSRGAAVLARAVRLAFAELDQAAAELGDLAGREVGQVVIGALPLSRSHVLPRALAGFRRDQPRLRVTVRDGVNDELLAGLRRGEIDFVIGALRDPAPIGDVVQEAVFDDTLVLLSGAGHPLQAAAGITPADLVAWPWLVARGGTPTRALFHGLFAGAGLAEPESLIETGSVILMREMVQDNRHLACISRLQADREIARGLVSVLPFEVPGSARPIGITTRADWIPTPAQATLLDHVRAAGAK
jgi:DNA-binding transcriptional LysR family regulator